MRRRLLQLAALLLASASATAQTTGTISGTIVDGEGAPVIGALVRVVGVKGGAVAKAPRASFTLAGIHPGNHTIRVTMVGYEPIERSVHVGIGEKVELTLRLSDRVGDTVVKRVPKTARINEIDKGRLGSTIDLTGEEIEKQPRVGVLQSLELKTAVAGVGGGLSIRGARPSETAYLVDGTNVGDRFTGGTGAAGVSLFPMVSSLGTDEVQLGASGFGAEYGGLLGGYINSVTKHGRSDRYTGAFRMRTAVPFLYGSSSPLTVNLIGTGRDTTLPAAKLMSSGNTLYDFAFGGPFPGFDRLTFFVTGVYNPRSHTGATYEVYDMTPEYAAQRASAAREVWGRALEPTNLGLLGDQESAMRDISAKLRLSVDSLGSYLEVGGELGLSTREMGDWSTHYMIDRPTFFRQTPSGAFDYNDTLAVDGSLSEREMQSLDQNTIVNRLSAKYTHFFDERTFFDVNASYALNSTEIGEKDESKSYGLFDAYDIYRPVDADNDKIIDRYNSPTGQTLLNPYLSDANARTQVQLRNPITGLYEGGRSGGVSYNPYGLYGQIDGSTFPFPAHGSARTLEFRKSETFSLKGGYETNMEIGELSAQVKAGFNFSSYVLSRHNNTLPWVKNPFFDVYGEDAIYFDTTASGNALREHLAKPYRPFEGALYLQTRLGYKSIVFQPGVRIDFMNPNTKVAPVDRERVSDIAAALPSLPDASLKFQVSPRIAVGYPVTDKSQFRVNFAMMFKMPEFNQLYDNAFGSAQRGNQLFGDPDIEPQKVFSYEMGYEAVVGDIYHVDVVAFYRDIYNQSGISYVPAIPSPYTVYSVQEFGNVRGLELSLRRGLVDHIGAEINYTLQRAVGTASNPTANYGTLIGGSDPYTGEKRQSPLAEYPLDYDQTHNVSGTLSLAWGEGEGPAIGGFHLLENTDMTLTGTFATGLPYTRFNAKGEQIGEYNAERSPSVFNTEAHIERSFRLADLLGESAGNLEVTFFADIFNILNLTAPVAVYSATGSPDQNGTSLDLQIGDFGATPYYRSVDPARSETFSAAQYDRFGQRLYSPYADANLDGVVTQLEKYDGYRRWVTTVQSLRGNYQTPRTVYAGVKVKF